MSDTARSGHETRIAEGRADFESAERERGSTAFVWKVTPRNLRTPFLAVECAVTTRSGEIEKRAFQGEVTIQVTAELAQRAEWDVEDLVLQGLVLNARLRRDATKGPRS